MKNSSGIYKNQQGFYRYPISIKLFYLSVKYTCKYTCYIKIRNLKSRDTDFAVF